MLQVQSASAQNNLRGKSLKVVFSSERQLAEEWAAYAGVQFQSVMELGAIETIKETLKFNSGIGVLPLRSVLKETAAGELIRRPLPGDGYVNRRYICLVYRDEPVYASYRGLYRVYPGDRRAGTSS
ncbi:LysR family transcriptional regulator substrate-binding protein [Paenibacillus sp. DMB5]|uniref:LysR family transcriptional regulator substrate-binding protein n=1 Tax=Paenibacillus sp. DMB5 TaxID=1780103 RepID=UPI00076D0596|nr:LysR family transcriptional regulator substrate-binding protein [Paenibacillus sp. DMB5]KUP24840.1 hypothetical protein AWJ19_24195 [Paenibacillus sp. DMB5]